MTTQQILLLTAAAFLAAPGLIWFGWWLTHEADQRWSTWRELRAWRKFVDALADPKSGRWQ